MLYNIKQMEYSSSRMDFENGCVPYLRIALSGQFLLAAIAEIPFMDLYLVKTTTVKLQFKTDNGYHLLFQTIILTITNIFTS